MIHRTGYRTRTRLLPHTGIRSRSGRQPNAAASKITIKYESAERRAMQITVSSKPAAACVILHSGFANVGNWKLFASEADAEQYAEEYSGRVVDEDGLAEKFKAMH